MGFQNGRHKKTNFDNISSSNWHRIIILVSIPMFSVSNDRMKPLIKILAESHMKNLKKVMAAGNYNFMTKSQCLNWKQNSISWHSIKIKNNKVMRTGMVSTYVLYHGFYIIRYTSLLCIFDIMQLTSRNAYWYPKFQNLAGPISWILIDITSLMHLGQRIDCNSFMAAITHFAAHPSSGPTFLPVISLISFPLCTKWYHSWRVVGGGGCTVTNSGPCTTSVIR